MSTIGYLKNQSTKLTIFEPAKKEDFEVEKVADDFYGTIAAKVNVKTK